MNVQRVCGFRRFNLIAAFLVAASGPPALHQAQCDEVATTESATRDAAFNRDILPILKQHCFECHSHDAKKTQGGLVLDSRSGWEIGGDSGAAIVPGKPNDSLLISAIRYEGLEMPPSGRLPDELVERLHKIGL